MKKNVLIVGAGPGGLMTANHLARRLRAEIARGEVTVTVLSASDRHVYEAGYLFMALDLKQPEQFTLPQKDLVLPGVTLAVDPAAQIDTNANLVVDKSGRKYPYDVLLVATGSVPARIPNVAVDGKVVLTSTEMLDLSSIPSQPASRAAF